MTESGRSLQTLRAGIDLVEVHRVGAVWHRNAQRMREVFLSANECAELDQILSSGPRVAEFTEADYVATRFAGKEAVVKALQLPPGMAFEYSDIEILGHSTLAIRLDRKLQAWAAHAGVNCWTGHAARTRRLASAIVLGVSCHA